MRPAALANRFDHESWSAEVIWKPNLSGIGIDVNPIHRATGLVFAIISRSIRDRSHVEDVAQDVFIRAHRGLRSFRGDAARGTGSSP
jgi:Sigma-70 region 2